MKRCSSCAQMVSENIITCPACGSHIVDTMKYIDDYRIQVIIHEGRSSIVCKAKKKQANHSVSIRIFTEKSGVDEHIAKRLENELIELQKLPSEHFVQHYAIKHSSSGHWYRLSEWVDSEDWGSIFMSGFLNDQRKVVTLFQNIASVLDLLHKMDHFMPYLILEDILIPRDRADDLHVKINYKLSRFLNARATHHGPMLQKLLDCHPDITNERPVNFKSGIWSLGKIFVEILSQDPNITDFSSKIDQMKGVDEELVKLIKLMLSDDPGMRPKTMNTVATALSRILDRLPYASEKAPSTQKKQSLIRELQWFKRTVAALIFLIVLIIGAGGVSWFYMSSKIPEKQHSFSQFMESYASSVAFIMVEYWLSDNGQTVYRNKVEGTAFLADANGYILTNRHVACPWLDDNNLFQAYNQLAEIKRTVNFDYKIYLWFEGAKAFNRLPVLRDSQELSDAYYLTSAYSTGGKGNLRIVGIPRARSSTGELIKSPFRNDFAVLKIDEPPIHLKPLPLATQGSILDIKRLMPIVILGFPLGNLTQADHINTSITRGHVRRRTKAIIQVDTSIYRGNSGGPAIDSTGKVIGIASGVVTEPSTGYFKTDTPLSDFGLILPISRPAGLIDAIKKGRPQWDGVLDFALESKLEKITALADKNKFKEAAKLSETMLKSSKEPLLIYVTGMLHFCSSNLDKSRFYFKKLSLIEHDNTTARLMLYIIDWIKGQDTPTSFTKNLFTMNWQHDDEFSGYLAKVLKERRRMDPQYVDYENRSEKSWRLFVEGLISEKNNAIDLAQKLYKDSIINATTNSDDWVYYLSFSRLNHIQTTLTKYVENKRAHRRKIKKFMTEAAGHKKLAPMYIDSIQALLNQFDSDELSLDQKKQVYNKLLVLAPDNRRLIGKIAFHHASHSEWQTALEFIDIYFQKSGRHTSLSVSLGLLKGQILKIMGRESEASKYLKNFSADIDNSWYRIVIKHLLSQPDKEELIKLAGNQPEKLITLHTALGLWEEGNLDMKKAAHHYREALSSYLEDWHEYNLSLARIMAIRQTQN